MRKYFIFFILFSAVVFFSSRFSNASKPSDFGLKEGDLISAIFSDDPDVYIVNEHGYKRLFLNPEIFKFYTHLGGFANIKLVTPEVRDSFLTVGFFRNCEDNDQKVFGTSVEGEDSGRLHWINKSGDQAVQEDPEFFKKVFCINRKEFNWYPRGNEFKALKEVPQYHRTEEAENPVICHHPSDQPNEPKNFQTIRVAPEALDAHFQHGDTKGACSTYELPKLTPQSVPTVTLRPVPSYTPIVYPPKLKLLSPNGGENFSIGNQIKVTWEHPESVSGVYFDLYKGGVYLAGLGGVGAGTQRRLEPYPSWTWDTTETSDFTSGSDFKLRMKNDSDLTVYDESDNYFSISGPNYPVTCDSLKSNPTYTRYFNGCAEEGRYDYVCFNKNYGTYQGCVNREYGGCTVNNTNASQNMACPVSPNVSPLPTSTSTPKPTSSATPIPVQEIAYNVDLAIVDIIPSPSIPEAGKDFTVDVAIKNLGPKALSLPTITLTINNPSGQKIYDPATSYSDESNNNVISPGSTVNVKFYSDMFSPRLPETTLNFPAGIYTMIASVNNLGYVEGVFYKKDFNSNNDTLTRTLEIKSASTPTPTPTSTINQIDFAVANVSVSPSSAVAGSSVTVSATFYNPSNTTQSIQVTIGKGVSTVSDGTVMSTTYYLSLPPGSNTQSYNFVGSYGAISSAPGSPANTYYPEASISGVGNGSIYINPYDPNTANNYLRATTAYTVSSAPTLPPDDVTPPAISSLRVDVAYSSAMASWTALPVWITDEPSTSQVEFGLTSSYGTITPLDSSGAFLRTVHSIILSPEYGYNLASNTTYHYRMISRDARWNTATSGDYTFTTGTAPTSQSNFSRNLTMGSTGNDVKQLQALLVNEVGYSADLITGYFGRITRDAVKMLQEKYGIKPTYGYFGEITRRTMSALISH